MKEQENLIGKRFGRWTVIEEAPTTDPSQPKFWCLCDCGTKSAVYMYSLLSKKSLSCGCLQREVASIVSYKHGCSKERLYHVWDGMKQRCNNPNHVAYQQYGARGISVCKEWSEDYTKFREFMLSHGYDPDAPFGECTIDRIDNDGNYCPENCRVISVQEQQNNKSDVFSFILDGRRTTISGAARSKGKTRSCIKYRLNHGWSLEDAIETPLKEEMKFEANGEIHTIKEWKEILNVTDNVIRGRLQTHTMQEIVDEWNEKGKLEVRVAPKRYYTANNVTECRAWWARKLNIPETTLRYKLKKKTMQEIVDDLRASGKVVNF